MKRTVEIEDTLQERVDLAIEELEELLRDYLKENPDADEVPDLSNDLDYDGQVHSIADSNVPVWRGEIRDTWYLHRERLEQAYENAGVGEDSYENSGMAAIYYLIYDELAEWYDDNAEDILADVRE